MRSTYLGVVAAVAAAATLAAVPAGARDLELTHQMVMISEGETVETPQGEEVTLLVRTHGSVIDEPSGQHYSQWCYGETVGSAPGAGASGAGYCTVVDDDGDAWWTSYRVHADGRPTEWSVMGGNGKYADATGEGTHRVVSERGDGQAWTAQSSGTLNLR
jgi:hypothetical protein